MTEQTEMFDIETYTVQKQTMDSGALADGFAEIEKEDIRVSQVGMHPDFYRDHFQPVATEIFDIDEHKRPIRLWGAEVSLNEDLADDYVSITGASDSRIINVQVRQTPTTDADTTDAATYQSDPDPVENVVNEWEIQGRIEELLDELRRKGHLDT